MQHLAKLDSDMQVLLLKLYTLKITEVVFIL